MRDSNEFEVGARVVISLDHWDPELAGRTGTVGVGPEGLPAKRGVVWVELDVEEWVPGVTEASEVDLEFLKRQPRKDGTA